MARLFTDEVARQIKDGYLTAQHDLHRLPGEILSEWFQALKSVRAKEYLAHGVCRRLKILRRCVENVFAICPVDRVELLSHDERADLEINLHAFVINVHGLLDNLAWVVVFEKSPGLDRREVGLFTSKVRALLPQAAAEYLRNDRIKTWFRKYATNYRHALAHRIPLYIPPSAMAPDDRARHAELDGQIAEKMMIGDLDGANALMDEQAAIGSIMPVFKHSFDDEDAAEAVAFHPQVLADVNTVVEIVGKMSPPWLQGEEARRATEPGMAFRGARDFFLAAQLLGARRKDPEVEASREPWSLQAYVTCTAFALELVLKARLLVDGKEVPKGRDGHSYTALFRALPEGTRADVVGRLAFSSGPATETDLVDVLQAMERTFETWRYMYEGKTVPFNEHNMTEVFRAVQASIIEARPDFRPWPGVIWEGRDFT